MPVRRALCPPGSVLSLGRVGPQLLLTFTRDVTRRLWRSQEKLGEVTVMLCAVVVPSC